MIDDPKPPTISRDQNTATEDPVSMDPLTVSSDLSAASNSASTSSSDSVNVSADINASTSSSSSAFNGTTSSSQSQTQATQGANVDSTTSAPPVAKQGSGRPSKAQAVLNAKLKAKADEEKRLQNPQTRLATKANTSQTGGKMRCPHKKNHNMKA